MSVIYNVSSIQSCAVAAVLDERARQDAKWGVQNHAPIKFLAILTEEVGELAKECVEEEFGGTRSSNLRAEAVQVAAVALAIIESLDRADGYQSAFTRFPVGEYVYALHNLELTGKVIGHVADNQLVTVLWDLRCFTTPFSADYYPHSLGKMSELPAICNPNAQTCCSFPNDGQPHGKDIN